MSIAKNTIPEMGPQGRSWYQPHRSEIIVDNDFATMSQVTFDNLKECSGLNPRGIYEGKMWKVQADSHWELRWYGYDEDPSKCSLNDRIITIVD